MGSMMDAHHFRERAEVLLRLADDLSLNDLGRFQLMALAEDLRKRARELDAQTTPQPQLPNWKMWNSPTAPLSFASQQF
jgi:hypothetical protein